MRRREIACAVIGTGRIGSSLEQDVLREKPASHAGAIVDRGNRRGDCRLVGGADPDPERLAAFGELWQLPSSALFADPEELVAQAKPGIVHIAADTDAHIELLRLCLRAAVPVIVLEKPIAATLTEAEQALSMVQEAQAAGRSRVIVNHERRFSRDYQRTAARIRAGAAAAQPTITPRGGDFGALLSVHCRLFMGRRRDVRSLLWHDGTHLVDILRYLVGDWRVVAVHGGQEARRDNVLIVGATAAPGDSAAVGISIEASPGRDHLVFELDLSFQSGRIRIGNGVYEQWVSVPSPHYQQFRSLTAVGRGRNPYAGKTGYFRRMMDHAVRMYRAPQTPRQSSYMDGLAALRILDDIVRALPAANAAGDGL